MPDGTTTQTDVTLSPGQSGTPPATYTQEQYDKAVRDARSAVGADVGRLKAEADKALKAANAATERLSRLQKEQEERELEAVKDKPDALAVIKERQQRRQKETELEEAQRKLDEANARLQELTNRDSETARERTTREIAERLKVDPVKLVNMAKFTNGSAEAIEALAKELPKQNQNRNSNLRVDSSEVAGGTAKTKLQIMDDYGHGKMNAVQYAEQMKAIGAIP